MSELNQQEVKTIREMIESLSELKVATLDAFTKLDTMHSALVRAEGYPREAALDVALPLADQLMSVMGQLREVTK